MSAVVALTGCEMLNHHNEESDRTAGRALDDKTITAAVEHDLNREPVYKFNSVDVKTFDGVVQLSGFVDTQDQKQRAGDIARNEQGVTQVVNNISLKPQGNNMAPTGHPTGYDNNYNNNNNSKNR
ncbi:MAG TPA: BON domain-containing protein [Candidatus Polarisedimenticolia bacterium]|nr:BON domain-containing protein [Candidatus Polarisedimenticolia bacterium]